MTPQEAERRGEEARQIVKHPIYVEAFQTIEDRLVSQLAQVEIAQERAEYLRSLLVANRKIRQYLEQVMHTGTLEAMDEQRRKGALQHVQDFMSRIPR